jgi:hypothetical protein
MNLLNESKVATRLPAKDELVGFMLKNLDLSQSKNALVVWSIGVGMGIWI